MDAVVAGRLAAAGAEQTLREAASLAAIGCCRLLGQSEAEATGWPAASVSPAVGKSSRRLLLYLRHPATQRPRPIHLLALRRGDRGARALAVAERQDGLACSAQVEEEPSAVFAGGGGHGAEHAGPA